jgi:hypothetical protein
MYWLLPVVGQYQIVLLRTHAFMIQILEQNVILLIKLTVEPVRQRLDYLLALLTISVALVLLRVRLVG